jgi:signal transduction histidine kinase
LDPEALLRKYAGGVVPPLLARPGESTGNALLNGEFVKIYQRGFSGLHSIALGVLVADGKAEAGVQKWVDADYTRNRWAQADWLKFCSSVRERGPGDRQCENCDRRYAAKAEEAGRVIAYMCDHGMIDIAVPVSVNGVVVAVLLSGQRVPRPGTLWNPEFVRPGGIFRELAEGEHGEDAWEESKRRTAKAENDLGFKSGFLGDLLQADCQRDPGVELSPDGVSQVMAALETAREHLSELAAATYYLEKARAVAWIRAKAAESLRCLTGSPESQGSFHESLVSSLSVAATYFGADVAAVVSYVLRPTPRLDIISLLVDGRPTAPASGASPGNRDLLTKLDAALGNSYSPAQLPPNEAGMLLRLLTFRRCEVSAFSAVGIKAGQFSSENRAVILGRTSGGLLLDALPHVDLEALHDVLGTFALVLNVAHLVEELELAARKQATFLRDVAHDIRNPIQNIVMKAARLGVRDQSMSEDEIARQSKRLSTQVKRLHLLSQRVWTLEEFERGDYQVDSAARTPVFDALRQCGDSLEELARQKTLTLSISRAVCQRQRDNRVRVLDAYLKRVDPSFRVRDQDGPLSTVFRALRV